MPSEKVLGSLGNVFLWGSVWYSSTALACCTLVPLARTPGGQWVPERWRERRTTQDSPQDARQNPTTLSYYMDGS